MAHRQHLDLITGARYKKAWRTPVSGEPPMSNCIKDAPGCAVPLRWESHYRDHNQETAMVDFTSPMSSTHWKMVWTEVMLIGLLRYAHVIEKHQNCVLNTAALSMGWICAAGLIMVGNFQVDYAKVLHYVGAGVAFPTSMLFVCLQAALTYRLAKTQSDFELQHASAIFEWLFAVIIMLFYGTFAFEFGDVSSDTLMVLVQGGAARSLSRSEWKMEDAGGQSHPQHEAESLSML
ncbi:hypothetical protein Z043_115134 [Scleropages formosus]|uniref:CWH43-like N-terminal domain-containing protein n=1 Tax=Scleropages formosus TaxID=113540 RepID=A0A0P7U8T2_SCLFO|nr:hypothetical protein Z043_115134 [Scleropages formosus]